ncbi:hypothetical protein C8R44DRAFT_754171 [Mycena epipterygia]|nr:hypothetical protein C8R44DRAFT_754171 [Mycena epipterygia]
MRFLSSPTAFFLLFFSSAAGERDRLVPFSSRRGSHHTRYIRSGHTPARRLVPFSQSGAHNARSWKRALVPRNTVNLAYGLETASYPSTALEFTAHPETPIVLLEDIGHLVDSVVCHERRVELNFVGEDAYAEAVVSWSAHPAFMLVTSHHTCNPPDQRGAWLITAIRGLGAYPQIKLTAEPVPLREIGTSFRISHAAEGISSSWSQSKALGKRLDDVFSFGHDFDFAARQQLFPNPNLLQRSNADELILGNEVLAVSQSSAFQVFCVDCSSHSNFSVGVELEVTDLGTKISDAHINITVQQFEHDIQLEFSLNSSLVFHQSMDVIGSALPDLGLSIPDIGSVGFFYGGTVTADMDVSGGLNFSIGAKTSVPPGAGVTFVMVGDANSSATGWDGASFDFIPFRLNSGSFNASAQLSLSPFLELEISLLKGISASARIGINTPQITADASVVSNVNRDCQPIGPTDLESFSSALTFGAGASLDIHVSTDGTILPDANRSLFGHNITFGSIPPPSAPECFIVADDNPADQATLAGQVPAPTGTLRAAAAAVPSFDVAKIEAYYSASGALPTNVNYTQLVQATAVPPDIQSAVNKIVGGGAGKNTGGHANGNGAGRTYGSWGFVLLAGLGTGIAMATSC